MPTPTLQPVAEILVAYWRHSATQDMKTRDLCQRLTTWFQQRGHGGLEWAVRHGHAPDMEGIQEALRVACADFALRNLILRLAPPPSDSQGHSSPSVRTLHVSGGAPHIHVGDNHPIHPQPQAREEGGGPDAPDQRKLPVLFLTAAPRDTARLRVDQEIREIGRALQEARVRERFLLEPRMAVGREDLTRELLTVRPRYVHFSGHGNGEGEVCFEGGLGESQPVGGDILGNLFGAFSGEVECVVLSACHSGKQIAAIARHVPYVIGMREAVVDGFAIAFSIGFYRALGAGCGIRQAFELGRVQLQLRVPSNKHAPTIPILFEQGRPVA